MTRVTERGGLCNNAKMPRAGGLFVFAAAVCAAANVFATDLEDFYFRHDFSGGGVEASFGASSTLTKKIR